MRDRLTTQAEQFTIKFIRERRFNHLTNRPHLFRALSRAIQTEFGIADHPAGRKHHLVQAGMEVAVLVLFGTTKRKK